MDIDLSQLSRKERKALRRQEKISERAGSGRRMWSRIIMWCSVVLGIFGVIGVMTFFVMRVPVGATAAIEALATTTPSDWVLGSRSSQVTLIEYSDFQCPACAYYQPLVRQLTKEFGERIAFAYRHFPLAQHLNASLASRVSEAAGLQGMFWEMHGILFDHQTVWGEEPTSKAEVLFQDYAKDLGLNMTQFAADLHSPSVREKVDRDYASGVAAGINGTPSFFLNGRKIQNPRTYDEFRIAVSAAFDAKN